MALIRKCQPKTIKEWGRYYFKEAYTKTKKKVKVTKEMIDELGERLYAKITEVVISEWSAAFGGKVFIVFSARIGNKKDILNKKTISEIKKEIRRLQI